jgi:hypothetical protein
VRERERGSVLLLVPAGLLVLIVLGGIAVDSAAVLLAQRELASTVAAAANDAAGAAVADPAFYGGGDVQLDAARAREVATASLHARRPRGVEIDEPLEITVQGRQVCVSATASVRRIFAPAVPGASRSARLHATASATLAEPGQAIPTRLTC